MTKHNKKRNTAFIYEILVREVIKQSINANKEKRNTVISILKESFKKGTELRRELDLYKTLLETKNLNEKIAEKLLNEVIKQHETINIKKLFKEQSAAISKINKQISKEVFNNFVPNYKSLATIAQMFGNVDSPKAKVLLETKVIQNLSEKSRKNLQKPKVSGLVMKSFVNRFNETYADLLKEQKDLLSKYASSFQDNGTEFKFYINEEIERLRKVIKKSCNLDELKKDATLKEKLNKVLNILNRFNQKPIDKKSILQVMKYQNLAKELESQ